MKSIIKHSVVAALCSAPLLSHAFWSTVDRGATVYDPGTQMRTDGQHGPWRDRLWQGRVFNCERGGGNLPCRYTFGESVSFSFAKTIGADFTGKGNTTDAATQKAREIAKLGLNSSLTWTKTNTHDWNVSREIAAGHMVRPYTYVERRWTWGHYFGHWKKTGTWGGPSGRGGMRYTYKYDWFWQRDGWWGAHVAQSNDHIATFAIWKPR